MKQLLSITQPPRDSDRGKLLMEANFHLIQTLLDRISRRSGLSNQEVEDFHSWVFLKILENNYRILSKWEGRSSFSTYLTVVLTNLMRDYQIRIWGKWRASTAAIRHGREVVLLERLWRRDGLPLEKAIEQVRSKYSNSLSGDELEQIAMELPVRFERRWVGEEELLQISFNGPIEDNIEEREQARTIANLLSILPLLLLELPKEDRLLLRLYYRDGLSMTEISALLQRRRRELYSRHNRCLKKLRKSLEERGLKAEQVEKLQLEGDIW